MDGSVHKAGWMDPDVCWCGARMDVESNGGLEAEMRHEKWLCLCKCVELRFVMGIYKTRWMVLYIEL